MSILFGSKVCKLLLSIKSLYTVFKKRWKQRVYLVIVIVTYKRNHTLHCYPWIFRLFPQSSLAKPAGRGLPNIKGVTQQYAWFLHDKCGH